MISIRTRDEFIDAVIAQDDDNDYDESGYVAVVIGDEAALSKYGHCSCYDTWDDLTGNGSPRWDWTGTVEELVQLARGKKDPSLPERTAMSKDYDYDHLMEVYRQIIEWHEGA